MVSLSVEVRRFKCVNPHCPQTTFVEYIDALAPSRQRCTVGLHDKVRSIAHALGGAAAARQSARLGMPVSRDTLLRELRRAGAVDLEQRCPSEVPDGRESSDVAAWLKRHPAIQWVARDRAGAYSDATRSALPQARPIADRWHLLVNLPGSLLVTDVVLVEAVWTLRSAFDQGKAEQLIAVRSLLQEAAFAFEDREAVAKAVELFEAGTCGFADCLVVAKHARQGCEFTATIDRGMRKLPGVKVL